MANFKLNQSGEQIQADLNLIDSNSATQGQVLTANGTGGASWQNASGGTEVVANPVLAGTESDLTGLEIDGTKYKVPTGGGGGGSQLYVHYISFYTVQGECVTTTIINNSPDKMLYSDVYAYLRNNLLGGTKDFIVASGMISPNSDHTGNLISIYGIGIYDIYSPTSLENQICFFCYHTNNVISYKNRNSSYFTVNDKVIAL